MVENLGAKLPCCLFLPLLAYITTVVFADFRVADLTFHIISLSLIWLFSGLLLSSQKTEWGCKPSVSVLRLKNNRRPALDLLVDRHGRKCCSKNNHFSSSNHLHTLTYIFYDSITEFYTAVLVLQKLYNVQ